MAYFARKFAYVSVLLLLARFISLTRGVKIKIHWYAHCFTLKDRHKNIGDYLWDTFSHFYRY